MARTLITIGIRSIDAVETTPGVFDYTYTKVENIPAQSSMSTISLATLDTKPLQVTQSTQLQFNMANDSTDIVRRISWVEYLGITYEVSIISYTRPTATITLGGPWNG